MNDGKKTLIVNCSYRNNRTTAELCKIEQERFGDESMVLHLPDVKACHDCDKKPCNSGVDHCCLRRDTSAVKGFVDLVHMHDRVVFAVPVYLNAPTPKILAMLSRINSYNDVAGRNLFADQEAYITAVADVSGTQQTISIMMSALGMLGFRFPSKGNREHILEWKTGKIRGGDLFTTTYYLEDRAKGGNE